MNEVFPVLAGAVIGVVTHRFVPVRLRLMALAALAVLFGTLASVVSGETALSLGFIPIDVAQVLIVAAGTYALDALWQRRSRTVR
jgi:hypothetical protein